MGPLIIMELNELLPCTYTISNCIRRDEHRKGREGEGKGERQGRMYWCVWSAGVHVLAFSTPRIALGSKNIKKNNKIIDSPCHQRIHSRVSGWQEGAPGRPAGRMPHWEMDPASLWPPVNSWAAAKVVATF